MPPRDFVASPAFLRASNLNHPTIKGLNKNISCYISAKNEARLKSLISRTNAKSTDNASMKDSLEIHTVPTKVAQGALLGFKPFGNDLEKQARYTTFLQNIVDKSESNEPMQERAKEMTEQEAAETREFSKAAMLYRPLAEMMSQRFTSKVEVPAVAKKVEKVFGPDTTRSVTKWQPAKTLCQRFAVRYVEDSDLEDEEDRNIEPLNAETMAVLVKERDAMLERGDANNMLEEVPQTEILTKDELLAELHAGFDMMKNNDAEAIEKPGMELFEAIFAESDNEEFEPLPMDTSDIKAPTKVSSSSKEIDANEYFSSKASFSSTVIQKIAPSESSVRPMFKKPKNVKSAGTEKKRKPKMTALSFDPEEEVEQPNVATSKKPKVRPSAADYM